MTTQLIGGASLFQATPILAGIDVNRITTPPVAFELHEVQELLDTCASFLDIKGTIPKGKAGMASKKRILESRTHRTAESRLRQIVGHLVPPEREEEEEQEQEEQ